QKVLVWGSCERAKGGDGDGVMAIAPLEEMKMIDVGYIPRVEFVSADPAAKTMTFKIAVPDAVLKSAASVQPGRWIKVTAPMEQPGTGTTLASAMATEKPAPRPPKPQPAVAAAGAGGGGRGGRGGAAAAAVKANGGISGAWTFAVSLGGNTIEAPCDVAQDGPKLGGTCKPMGGDPVELTGTVMDKKVNFSYTASLGGNS